VRKIKTMEVRVSEKKPVLTTDVWEMLKGSLKMSVACFENMINDELISPDADFVDDLVKRQAAFRAVIDYMEELE